MHGNARQVKKLAERAYKENVEIGPFLEKGRKVLFVPGNHDSPATAEFMSKKYGITNLQHYPVSYKGVGFFGCGGANIGINQVSEKEMSIYLKKGFDSVSGAEKKIMIRKAIEDFQPDIHICGHIHEAEGVEEEIGKTKVFCVGSQGRIIEV